MHAHFAAAQCLPIVNVAATYRDCAEVSLMTVRVALDGRGDGVNDERRQDVAHAGEAELYRPRQSDAPVPGEKRSAGA